MNPGLVRVRVMLVKHSGELQPSGTECHQPSPFPSTGRLLEILEGDGSGFRVPSQAPLQTKRGARLLRGFASSSGGPRRSSVARPLGLRRPVDDARHAGQMHVGETTLRCSLVHTYPDPWEEAVNNGHYFWARFWILWQGHGITFQNPARRTYKPPRANFRWWVSRDRRRQSKRLPPPPVAGMAQEAVTLLNMRPLIPADL